MTRRALALCAGLAAANLVRFSPPPAVALVACARAPCALAAAGWWWGSRRLHALAGSILRSRVGTAEQALVEVEETPRVGRFDVRVRALVLRWGALHPHEHVLLQLPAGRAPPRGARLSLLGILRPARGLSHGFDERRWLARQGIHVVLRGQVWRVAGRRRGVAGVGDALARRLADGSALGLRGERRAVLQAIVLGRTQGIAEPLLARFRASGLYHVLAVDGLKVAAVGGGAIAIALFAGLGRIAAEVAALLAVGAYTLAVGFHPSVVRAAVAAALGSLAWLSARERDRWHALAVGAVGLLAWNPAFLLDAGFQLSFAAVASIFVVSPRVVRALEGYPVPRGVAQLIGVSTACGLATAPVTWFQFHQVSLVTVPANVVGVPVVAEMLGLALATAAIAPVAPSLATVLAQVNGVAASFVAECARIFGGLPAAQVRSPAAVAALGGVLLSFGAWISSRSTSSRAATGRRSRARSAASASGSATTRRST